jgi:uncharacterized protein (DUF58 family)
MKWWPWKTAAAPAGAHGARVVARRYHVHTPGIVYVGTTMLLSAGAANSQNNLLFWAFGIAVGGLLVSGLLSGMALMRVGLERLEPEGVHAGDPLRVRYRIHNRGFWLPCYAVHVVELPSENDPTPAEELPGAFVDVVPTRGSVVVEAYGVARDRGVARLRYVRVWTTFPFGIAKKSVTFEEPQSVKVWPRVWPLKPGTLQPPPRGGERSRMTPRLSGDGAELFSLRAYQDGDPIRTIAWRPSARSPELLVRQAAESTTARVRVVIDVPEAVAEPAAVEDAISLAASAFIELEHSGVSLSMHAPALGVHLTSAQGRQHVRRMLDELALAAPVKTTRRARPDPVGHRMVVVHAGAFDGGGVGAQHLSALRVAEYREGDAQIVSRPLRLSGWRAWLRRFA